MLAQLQSKKNKTNEIHGNSFNKHKEKLKNSHAQGVSKTDPLDTTTLRPLGVWTLNPKYACEDGTSCLIYYCWYNFIAKIFKKKILQEILTLITKRIRKIRIEYSIPKQWRRKRPSIVKSHVCDTYNSNSLHLRNSSSSNKENPKCKGSLDA